MLIRSPMWKNVTKSGNMSKYAEDRSFWTWVKWSHWSSQAFPGPGSSAWFAKLRPRDDLKTGRTPDISWPPDHQTYQILIMTGWGDMQIHANPINIYKPVHKTGAIWRDNIHTPYCHILLLHILHTLAMKIWDYPNLSQKSFPNKNGQSYRSSWPVRPFRIRYAATAAAVVWASLWKPRSFLTEESLGNRCLTRWNLWCSIEYNYCAMNDFPQMALGQNPVRSIQTACFRIAA